MLPWQQGLLLKTGLTLDLGSVAGRFSSQEENLPDAERNKVDLYGCGTFSPQQPTLKGMGPVVTVDEKFPSVIIRKPRGWTVGF